MRIKLVVFLLFSFYTCLYLGKKNPDKESGQQPSTSQGQQPAKEKQPSATEQSGEGEKRPPKGAWKDKKKQPKPEGQSSAGQQAPPQQQQPSVPIQKSESVPGRQQSGGQEKPHFQDRQKKQHEGHRPQQQQQRQTAPVASRPSSGQHPRSESVASHSSQRSDRSGGQKDAKPQPQPEDMLAKMKQLSLIEASFPIRDSVTKTSKRFKRELISTNYLTLNLKSLPDIIYHYDIKFDPDRPKKFMFPAFHIAIAQHFPKLVNRVAFDGASSFYSIEKVPNTEFPPVNVPSPDAGRDKSFKISIKLAATIDMRIIKQYPNYSNGTHMQQAVQALDIVLRSAFDRDGLIRYKRSVFTTPRKREIMKDNYELFIGLYQSFVMGERPYLNVDVSHKAFPSGTDHLEPLYQQYRNFQDILRGLSLVYTSPMTNERKTYKFNAVRGSADSEMFNDEQDNNRRKSVAQYFQEKGHRLRFPKNPCLHIGPAARNILVPMEFLSIPHAQALNGKAPESCTRDMVRVAATSTDVRKERIMDLLRNINYKGVETIKQFGLVVGENFIDVNSHILDPPKLQYKENVVTIKKPGQWDAAKFLDAQRCTNWGILVMDSRTQNDKIQYFGNGFVRMAGEMGLDFAPFDQRNVEKPNKRLNKNELDQIINDFKRDKIELLFVIISPFGDQYQDVKKSAELRCGMLTQCIKSGTIDRMNPSTLGNILLKVNSKLGGSNQIIAQQSRVSINRRPFMVIGTYFHAFFLKTNNLTP